MIFLRRVGCQSRMIFGRAIIPLRFLCVRDLFRKPVPTFRGHALVSRFRSSHHCAAHSFANFGIKGTLAIYDSTAVFGFEVPIRTRGYNDRNFKSTALVPFCHTVNALGAPRDVTAPRLLSLARFHPGHRRATLPARRADAVRWSTIKATVCHAPARRGARERAPSYAPVRPCPP